jgi:hypothetical protein
LPRPTATLAPIPPSNFKNRATEGKKPELTKQFEGMNMAKQVKKSRASKTIKAVKRAPSAKAVVIEPVTDVVTERTYVTTEPEVEIRRPATLAQALTQPPVAVVKPKKKVRRQVVARTRRAA